MTDIDLLPLHLVDQLLGQAAEIERLRTEIESLWVELENWKECFCQAAQQAEQLAKLLRELSEVCRAAIKAGDWKVDGACDPDSLLSRADAALSTYDGATK